MQAAAAARYGPWQALLPASLIGWALLLAGGPWLLLPAYCTSIAYFAAGGLPGLELALRFNPPGGLAAGWLAMLLAMMPPLLARPVAHVWARSPAVGRARSAGLFVLGYASVWMAAGVLVLLFAVALHGLAGGPGWMPLLLAAGIALLWQASPWKQACLGRCRGRPLLAPSGLAADRDALRFGLGHGFWCAGACWAMMAVPLVAGRAHLPAMALVALLLFAERRARPRPGRREYYRLAEEERAS